MRLCTKSLTTLTVLLIFLAACAESPPQVAEVTREVEVLQTVEVIQEVTTVIEQVVTREVEVTRLVTVEPTPTAAQDPAGQEQIAANYLDSQEQGSVSVELTRVLCMSRQAFLADRDLGDEKPVLEQPSVRREDPRLDFSLGGECS